MKKRWVVGMTCMITSIGKVITWVNVACGAWLRREQTEEAGGGS
jgi:hypothetical protein